jgi:glutamate synthase (NADPH/NADH) small chain
VAVIGSGPAGLATAQVLCEHGAAVTVYERENAAGGLLMYGIPNMKLDKNIIKRAIKRLESQGVSFVYNATIAAGGSITPEQLQDQYEAIVIATGSKNPRIPDTPGIDLKGVYPAVTYLTANTKGLLDPEHTPLPADLNAKGKHVMIIGGGDTGTDCAGTALRQGAVTVRQLEMFAPAPEQRAKGNSWPLWPNLFKVDYGQDEAIKLFGHDPREFESTASQILGDENGHVNAIETVHINWVPDPNGGRPIEEHEESSKVVSPCDLVLIAAGFLGPEADLLDAFGIERDGRSNIKADEATYRTNVPHIYAAGDCRRGQSLVVWALHEGVECAKRVAADLGL